MSNAATVADKGEDESGDVEASQADVEAWLYKWYLSWASSAAPTMSVRAMSAMLRKFGDYHGEVWTFLNSEKCCAINWATEWSSGTIWDRHPEHGGGFAIDGYLRWANMSHTFQKLMVAQVKCSKRASRSAFDRSSSSIDHLQQANDQPH